MLSLCSCERYTYDINDNKTQAAQNVYNEISYALKNSAKDMELMQKIDMYLQATDVRLRDSLNFYLLEDYRLFTKSNGEISVSATYENSYMDIVRSNTSSLNTLGNKWTIHEYYNNYYNDTVTISQTTIENTGNNSWTFTLKSKDLRYDDLNYDLVYNITRTSDNTLTNNLINNDYSYSSIGSSIGTITSSDEYLGKLITDYQIDEKVTTICYNNSGYFKNGIVSMTIKGYKYKNDSTPTITDNAKAEILSRDKINMTFRGITETCRY